MSGTPRRSRRGFGLHPEIGRRYERADLTAHRVRSAKQRRRALLLERVSGILTAYYARELEVDPSEVRDFVHCVAHRLRPEIQTEWTLDLAERRAFEIAEELFEELGGEDESESTEDPSSNGSG